jgi:splicing factor 3B subunit 4
MTARFLHDERNQDATIYIGGIDEKTTDSLIWELMLQVGPVVSVHLPKDRVSQTHQGYGFCEFQTEEDADYAVKIMNQIKLFGRPIRVNKASADKRAVINVGADLHVSGLDPSIDERTLLNIFSTFGPLMAPPRVCDLPKSFPSLSYSFPLRWSCGFIFCEQMLIVDSTRRERTK